MEQLRKLTVLVFRAMPIHRITRFGLVNAYLVEEDDGLTLIDTMLPRSQKKILAAAEALGAPIRRIALTHAHHDHIGCLDALDAALPDAEVLISARDARLLAKDKSLDPGEPQDKLRGSVPGASTTPTRTFAPGDTVGSLEVHAAPGHTPGQVAFLDTRDRTLYCADAYSTLGGVATTAKANWRFPLPGRRHVAQADGARDRAGAARARPRAARARPRQGRRGARRRDGPRDRARALTVPRRGLDRAQVVDAAVAIADADGLEAVTLARVAAALGVRSPSLYNHVDGRDGLLRGVAARAHARARRRAAPRRDRAAPARTRSPRSRQAQRAYARAHPGRYAATVAAPAPGDVEHEAAAAEAVDVLTSVLGRAGSRATTRSTRSARYAAPCTGSPRSRRPAASASPSTATRRSRAWSPRCPQGSSRRRGRAAGARTSPAASPARRRARAGGGRSARAPRRSRAGAACPSRAAGRAPCSSASPVSESSYSTRAGTRA